MGLALRLYESLTEAPDDATRFRLIVDTFDALEQHWPRRLRRLSEPARFKVLKKY